MSDFLSPNTNLALLQATQNDAGKLQKSFKSLSQKNNVDIDKVTEAAQEFEAVFISEMLKPMFQGLELEEPFGGGKGEEVFQSFLLQEYGKIVSQTGSIGISDHVKQELINIQENTNNEAISSE